MTQVPRDNPRIDAADEAAIRAQLKRRPRGIDSIGHRCPCGNPDVVTTEPRLPNGTPFPTTFYLTCPRAASRIGTLEGTHVMKEMQERLGTDEELGDEVLDRLGDWWASGPCVERPLAP